MNYMRLWTIKNKRKKKSTKSYLDSNDSASRCRSFYYYPSNKDLRLSPSAKSSTSSLAKSFEVILSERKTPTLVHKPCQALYQCPYVKLIPISKLTPLNYYHFCVTYCNLPPELYKACRERNWLSGRQIVNKSFACICGKIWMKTMVKEIQSVLWKRCIKVIQDNTAAVRMT